MKERENRERKRKTREEQLLIRHLYIRNTRLESKKEAINVIYNKGNIHSEMINSLERVPDVID